eukprot:3815948-Rhodomonas_salina.2
MPSFTMLQNRASGWPQAIRGWLAATYSSLSISRVSLSGRFPSRAAWQRGCSSLAEWSLSRRLRVLAQVETVVEPAPRERPTDAHQPRQRHSTQPKMTRANSHTHHHKQHHARRLSSRRASEGVLTSRIRRQGPPCSSPRVARQRMSRS